MSKSLRRPTQEAIIEAAFEVLSRNPGASLSEITVRAGVGRATLHRHFTGRDELIQALARTALQEMDAAAQSAAEDAVSYTDALKRVLAALIPLGDRHGFLAREPIEDVPEIAAALARQKHETRQMIEAAKHEGLFAQDIPTDWITHVFDHMLYVAWQSVKSGEATHRQAAALAWRTLTSGLREDQDDT